MSKIQWMADFEQVVEQIKEQYFDGLIAREEAEAQLHLLGLDDSEIEQELSD